MIIEDSEASYVKKSVTRKTLLDPTIQSTASTATLTPNANEDDQVVVTALAANMTIAAPSGSPVQGQKLVIRIEDNGTSRTLTWNAIYEVVGVTLPTSTTASKKIYVGCIYNSTTVLLPTYTPWGKSTRIKVLFCSLLGCATKCFPVAS